MPSDLPLYLACGVALAAGIGSFVSPCVLSMLPVYFAYLSGSCDKDMSKTSVRFVLIRNTLFFVLGISVTFFLLGFAATSLGTLLISARPILARVGGALILVFGLLQTGVLHFQKLESEHRLPFQIDKMTMNPLTAFIFGVVFSFAWTPCVGPILASILVMAGTASTQLTAAILIIAYTLGLAIPFLVVAFFTQKALDYFKSHRAVLANITKVGGVILMLIGVLMLLGFTGAPDTASTPSSSQMQTGANSADAASDKAPDFELKDEKGNTVSLSQFKGKTVVLNFWATDCPYCIKEIPDLNELYEKTGKNAEDVVMLGIVNGATDPKPFDEAVGVLRDAGGQYPCLNDSTGKVFSEYGIIGYPVTVFITPSGDISYVGRGAMPPQAFNAALARAQSAKS